MISRAGPQRLFSKENSGKLPGGRVNRPFRVAYRSVQTREKVETMFCPDYSNDPNLLSPCHFCRSYHSLTPFAIFAIISRFIDLPLWRAAINKIRHDHNVKRSAKYPSFPIIGANRANNFFPILPLPEEKRSYVRAAESLSWTRIIIEISKIIGCILQLGSG